MFVFDALEQGMPAAMEIEDTGLLMDKEQDCITKYRDCAFYNSNHEIIPNLHNVLEPYENIIGDSELQSPKKSAEMSDCEVKECTSVNTIQQTEKGYAENAHEEKNNIASKFEPIFSEKQICEAENPKDIVKSETSVKHVMKPAGGQPRAKCTKPFSMVTYKRASSRVRPPAVEPSDGPGGQKLSVANNMHHFKLTKRNQHSSPSLPQKPLQPDIKKHPNNEDSCSIACATAITRQANNSRTLVASAPILRCTERAEKRKEFYSKLEEKHQALVAEKIKAEERTKEEVEAAVKQLRKSLVFKANPMPSFYHEGSSPKIVLKKQPSTRPKSPNLGRRKSCSDAGNSFKLENEKEASGQNGHHSHSSYIIVTATPEGLRSTKNGNGPCKHKVGPKIVEGRNKPVLQYPNEKTNRDIAVH